ncbi:MAG: PorV/PorQ family protein [Elusimicrobia bacterium]|nr:PorV/PorQ family protein [Elusimicrobiota bacterium]
MSYKSNRKINITSVAAVLLLCLSLPGFAVKAHAEDKERGQTGAKFLEFTPSARGAAMGESFTAVGDLSAITLNPGLMALRKYKEVAFVHGELYEENGLNFLAGVYPINNKYALGVDILGFDTKSEPLYDWNGNEIEGSELTYGGNAFGIAGAAMLSDKIAAGVNIKSLSEEICDENETLAAFDIGGVYIHQMAEGDLQLAASMNNLGGAIREEQDLPKIFRLGGGYIVDELTLAAEFNSNTKDSITHFNLGAEYWLKDTIAPRAGLKLGGDTESWAVGFGVKFRQFSFDYAFLPNRVLGATHRVGGGVKFGMPVEEKARVRKEPKEETKTAKAVKMKKKPGELLNIAVAELDGKNVSAMDAAIVSDFIRTELVRTQSFKVLDRQNMERILEEQSFQVTGCTSEECAVQMGKILNVKYMAVGSFSKFLETYYINVSLVDVETGEIVGAESEECSSGKELPLAAQKIAVAFSEQFGE